MDAPLDEADLIDRHYNLQVSSPGIERKLTRDFHFDYFMGEKVILMKPQTYMNLSGDSIIELAHFYKIKPEEINDVIISSVVPKIMHSFTNSFKNIGYNPISWLGYVGCLAIFLMGGIIPEEYKLMLIKIIVPVLGIIFPPLISLSTILANILKKINVNMR